MGKYIFSCLDWLRISCISKIFSWGVPRGYFVLSLVCHSSFFIKDGVYDWIVKYHKPNLVESMQANKPYIERTREFFGLLIISAALAINYFAI